MYRIIEWFWDIKTKFLTKFVVHKIIVILVLSLIWQIKKLTMTTSELFIIQIRITFKNDK